MRQDLINMERIVSWVAYAEPEFDFKPIMNEWAKVAIDELDFKNEAANQQRIAENLKTAQVNVIVPRIISLDGKELVTNKVRALGHCVSFMWVMGFAARGLCAGDSHRAITLLA